jgi:membrane protease subunit HflC
MVLSPDSEFFRYFGSNGALPMGTAAAIPGGVQTAPEDLPAAPAAPAATPAPAATETAPATTP